MEIVVYKGFEKDFYEKMDLEPFSNKDISFKLDYNNMDDNYEFELARILYSQNVNKCYMTYEEFETIYEQLKILAEKGRVEITIINNNIYPGIYPIYGYIDKTLYDEYCNSKEENIKIKKEKIKQLEAIYSNIYLIDNKYYGVYYNYELPSNYNIKNINNYYKDEIVIENTTECEYLIDIGDSLERYIEHYINIINNNYTKIGYKEICNTEISNTILKSLKALLNSLNIKTLYKYSGDYALNIEIRDNLREIGKKLLRTETFNFRNLSFYKNPDLSDEMEYVSQALIMEYIVQEAENAYKGNRYRDIFMTAPTGAGKSLIFQIPSIYLSEKYNKLIIIIEPLKGLMQNQYDKLTNCGYKKHAYLNSNIATLSEKERIINDVKEGKIDILYISPETLLSHSIDSLIGEREIGLIIVDEAHIVTTWGVGFRPDYWYLGTYINKLRTAQNKYGQNKKHHNFPIFACTATAVNGGKDDTVSETIISLYMYDPIKKIGSAKRENISFEIYNYEDKTKDEYENLKNEKLGERMCNWIDNNEKTIVYCPYSSIAHNIYNGEKQFLAYKVFENDISLYTGSDETTEEKDKAMEDFSKGKTKVMIATKAFGMGIDIPDIKNVFHYAVTGGLSDYIQEIGRAARDKDIKGKAIVDYFNGDMKYINTLFGMSQIKQYHIKKCLSIIYDAYQNKNHRNFMINPKMFESVFGNLNPDELERKLKIVLLMLEKDLYQTYKIYVLISRPGSMFTTAYACVEDSNITKVKSSKYSKYISKVNDGRENEVYGSYRVSDIGSIYEINLKGIWEDIYGSKLSFASFKFKFFAKNNYEVMPEIKDYLYSRVKLIIKSKCQNLSEIYLKTKEEIDYLTDVLSSFERKFFTKEEFRNLIYNRYLNMSKAEVIANSYFDIIDANHQCIKRREDNDIEKFQVSNGNIRELAMKILNKSSLIKKIRDLDKKEYEQFYSDNDSDNNLLKLLSILDLISYEVIGGNSPEIFIRLNAPDKIKNIIEEKVIYKNSYVEMAKEKHYRSVKILDYFFKNFKNNQNQERWDFVEKYFLGEDVEKEIDDKNQINNLIKAEPLIKYIDIYNNETYSLEDYKNWDNIINNLIIEEKYKFYCNLLKNNHKKIPDFAYTNIKVSNVVINTLFIYLKENIIIVPDNVNYKMVEICREKDWLVVSISEIDKILHLIPGEV